MIVVANSVYVTFVAVRSYVRSGAFCRLTPVHTVLNPETLSVMVSVPRAMRFGLPVLLAHFAQRRRKSSPILFCGTSIWTVPFVVFRRFTTTYPSAVVVWDVRSPAAETVIFPIPGWQ